MTDTLHIDGAPDVLALYASRANHSDDAGLDLILPFDIFVPRGRQATLDFGIRCMRTDKGGYYLYPRSSISKTPFRMANSVGIIDAGYRGNIMAKIDNTGPTDMTIKAGERLFQICMPDLRPFKVVMGGVLYDTERGSGGFGSTGGGTSAPTPPSGFGSTGGGTSAPTPPSGFGSTGGGTSAPTPPK